MDYFSEKVWIELKARQTIEVYEIRTPVFEINTVAKKMCGLFKSKEEHEIKRIHTMVDFCESNSCISKRLAHYFGEELNKADVDTVHVVRAVKQLFSGQ